MAGTRPQGPLQWHPFACVPPSRTPGSLGRRDAADPDSGFSVGDSPGPVGCNDMSALLGNARLSLNRTQFLPILYQESDLGLVSRALVEVTHVFLDDPHPHVEDHESLRKLGWNEVDIRGLLKAGAISKQKQKGKFNVRHRVSVWKFTDSVLFYRRPSVSMDLDGAPNAYHAASPADPSGKKAGALDNLLNATSNYKALQTAAKKDNAPINWDKANWVGVVKGADGTPVVQSEGKTKGFYVSATSLQDDTYPPTDPRRYVDAGTIPYVVLNPVIEKTTAAGLGDFAAVVLNQRDPKVAFGIVADVGPTHKLGECSKALLSDLGFKGGTENKDFIYILFPHTRENQTKTTYKQKTKEYIVKKAKEFFESRVGLWRIHDLFPLPGNYKLRA